MILIDNEGMKIQATMPGDVLKYSKFDIFEKGVYYVRNFSVALNNLPFKVTNHGCRITLLRRTEFNLAENDFGLNPGFTPIYASEILQRRNQIDYLVDIVGLVTAVSSPKEFIRDGSARKFISMEISDQTAKVECVLFDEYVDRVVNYFKRSGSEKPTIVLYNMKVVLVPAYFFGDCVVQNYMSATDFDFNPVLPETLQFVKCLAILKGFLDGKVSLMRASGPCISFNDDFVMNNCRKNISELMSTAEGGSYILWARIFSICEDSKWYFMGCTCGTPVAHDEDSNRFWCSQCERFVAKISPRYRLVVEVYDSYGKVKLILRDNEVESLLNKSCVQLTTEIRELSSKKVPYQLKTIIGKDILFKVMKYDGDTRTVDATYLVTRICDEIDIIRKVKVGNEELPALFPHKAKEIHDFIPRFGGGGNTEVASRSSLVPFVGSTIGNVPTPTKANGMTVGKILLEGVGIGQGSIFPQGPSIP